jgi:Fe(3+) dicitrate transport protein
LTGPGNTTFSSIGNVGDARHMGVEASVELDVFALLNHGHPASYGSLSLYGNVTLLDAEFTSGPFDGFAPTYAPDYQVKAGAIYRYKHKAKVALLGTMVGESYADANNTFDRFIPSYVTWDLTAEVNVFRDRISVIGGINNLFNEDFWSEIRDEGIAPAAKRNVYGGLSVKF